MRTSKQASPVVDFESERRRRLRAADAELLHDIIDAHGEIVQAGLDPHKVVDVVTRRAQELTRSDGAVVEILDGEDLVYWSASGSVAPHVGLHVKANASLSGLCVRTGRVLQCDDSENDARVDTETCRRVGVRSMLVAPLPYGDTIVGVLKVVSSSMHAYNADDVRTLELLNTLIGATLSHAVHHSTVEAALNSKLEADRLVTDEASASRERIDRVIEEQAFTIAFQPISELESGYIAGYEALARFRGPPKMSPDLWFDEARAAGLDLELELAVVRKALLALPRLPVDAFLAINVSPGAAASAEIESLCVQSAPERIVLEITEHSSVDDYLTLTERARGLRSLGVRLAIDDAGAGFASLRHVLRLEPDLIKLDKSITHAIDTQKRHQSLAAALLMFANGTSASIIAEGIETREELETLKRLGVPLGQGHYLGHPGELPSTRRPQ